MAFQPAARPDNTVSFPQQGGRENWRSDAFINIYMPTRDGQRRKLGAIGLKADKPLDKQVLNYIADGDEEKALEAIKERMQLTFARADGNNGTELDLG